MKDTDDPVQRANCNTMIEAQLVSFSAPTLDKLMAWSFQALGKSIAAEADARSLIGIEKYFSILKQLEADPAKHIHCSVQFISDADDLLVHLQVASMPFAYVPTIKRNVHYGLISGTLDQWRDAVNEGNKWDVTREFYLKLKDQFKAAGLNLWDEPKRLTHR